MEQLHEIHELVKLEDYDAVKQFAENILVANEGSPSKEEGDEDYLSKLQG